MEKKKLDRFSLALHTKANEFQLDTLELQEKRFNSELFPVKVWHFHVFNFCQIS